MGIVREIQTAEKDLIESVVQTAQKQGIKIYKKSMKEFARALIEGEKLYIRGCRPCVYLDNEHNYFVLKEAATPSPMYTLIYNFSYINGSQKELFEIVQSSNKEFPDIWLNYLNNNRDKLKEFIVKQLYNYYYDIND